MNNKKQTIKPEKRRALYIEYLKKHNGASTSDFLNYLTVNYSYKTSGNTLCEDRKYLEQLGYKFDVINNVYHLVYVPENLNNFSFNSCINQNLFLDWQLLKEITSQKGYCTRDFLTESILPEPTTSHLDTISRHLSTLHKQGYLERIKCVPAPSRFSLSDQASSVYCFSEDELMEFCYYHERIPDSGSESAILKPVFDFCNNLMKNSSDNPDYSPAPPIQHGRQNGFPEKITQFLNELNKLSFKHNKLDICYVDPNAQTFHFLFSVAIIFYNAETGHCYLLGESDEYPIMLLRLDRILFSATHNTKLKNKIYNSSTWIRIYNEIYSAALDYNSLKKPQEVVVYFSLFSKNIRYKLDALHESRKNTSTLAISDCGTFAIYKDTVRGLSSFSHFIRSFGSAARVEAPSELRELMISSTQSILNRYEEVSHE